MCLWLLSKIATTSDHLLVLLIAAERAGTVPDQVEIRFLNSFIDVVCLKLLGREFHTLGPAYLIDCFPKEMVLYGDLTDLTCDLHYGFQQWSTDISCFQPIGMLFYLQSDP